MWLFGVPCSQWYCQLLWSWQGMRMGYSSMQLHKCRNNCFMWVHARHGVRNKHWDPKFIGCGIHCSLVCACTVSKLDEPNRLLCPWTNIRCIFMDEHSMLLKQRISKVDLAWVVEKRSSPLPGPGDNMFRQFRHCQASAAVSVVFILQLTKAVHKNTGTIAAVAALTTTLFSPIN